MEFLIIVGLIILNGVFAMSEIAVVSARRARLEVMSTEEKNKGAAAALKLIEHPNHFLSTVQIGITFVGVLAGAFGGQTVARDIEQLVRDNVPALASYADTIGVIVIVGLTTYLSLVIGELVPKRIAMNNPESISATIARPMRLISRIMSPIVWFLSMSTTLVVRLIGIEQNTDARVSEMEILSMVREGTEAGVFGFNEEDMIEGVMRLDERRVGSVITPRTEIVWLHIDDDIDKVRERIAHSKYTTYPVIDESMDNVLGIVRSRELLGQILSGQPLDLKSIMFEPLYIPETVTISEVVNKFKETGIHTAMIVGEYGGIEGMVRMHDIIEEIFGELDGGEFDTEEPDIMQRQDGSYLIDGQVGLGELRDLFVDFTTPERERGNYETLAGFVMARLGRVPVATDHFEYGGLYFEVIDMDDVRVDKVLVQYAGGEDPSDEVPAPPPADDESSAGSDAEQEAGDT